MSERKSSALLHQSSLFSCGIMSGFLQAGLFNPWDRALYLSVKNNRPFVDGRNFLNPFAGVMQTITQRGLSGNELINSDSLSSFISILSRNIFSIRRSLSR